jgi:hypothetical protein
MSFVPPASFHRVCPLHFSAEFFFYRVDAFGLCGCAVALGNIGVGWEVGTSRVTSQGGSYALQFDGNLTAIQQFILGVQHAHQVEV